MQVYGIGEKKTPEPFIVACDKFIYIEILRESDETTSTSTSKGKSGSKNLDKITSKVVSLVKTTVSDLADEDGWAFLGDVGSLLQKKQPNFDSRNYGFEKLTPMIKSIEGIEIDERETPNSRHKLIYVRVKEKPSRNQRKK